MDGMEEEAMVIEEVRGEGLVVPGRTLRGFSLKANARASVNPESAALLELHRVAEFPAQITLHDLEEIGIDPVKCVDPNPEILYVEE
jgi:hypothetical protein